MYLQRIKKKKLWEIFFPFLLFFRATMKDYKEYKINKKKKKKKHTNKTKGLVCLVSDLNRATKIYGRKSMRHYNKMANDIERNQAYREA